MSVHPHEILIVTRDENGRLEVWQDGKTTGALTFGEMLEQVVALTTAGRPSVRGFPMDTPEGWDRSTRASFNGEAKP